MLSVYSSICCSVLVKIELFGDNVALACVCVCVCVCVCMCVVI